VHLISSLKIPQTEFFPVLIKMQTPFSLLKPVNFACLTILPVVPSGQKR